MNADELADRITKQRFWVGHGVKADATPFVSVPEVKPCDAESQSYQPITGVLHSYVDSKHVIYIQTDEL